MSKKFMLGILFAFVLVGMLAMAVAGGSRFPVVNAIVASVMLPVESSFNGLANAGNSVRGYWKAMTVMQSENAQLKWPLSMRKISSCALFWTIRSSTKPKR